MGWDWPFSPVWLGVAVLLFNGVLLFHAKSLFKSTIPVLAWKLIILLLVAGVFFFLLLARPYLVTYEPNPKEFKMISLTDLSGSMNVKDESNQNRRIDLVRQFLDRANTGSWLNQMKENFGKVENLGFSTGIERMKRDSWKVSELGKKTALGDALSSSLLNQTNGE